MAESEVFKQIASYGVGGLIAVFVFLLYRRDMKEMMASKAAIAAEFKEQAERVSSVVHNNTRVMTTLESTNAQLARAVEARAAVRVGKDDHGR